MKKAVNPSNFNFDSNNYPLNAGIRLIEASAGTGKTFALAHLVLRLLTEVGKTINQLLVVTFTIRPRPLFSMFGTARAAI